MMFFNKNQKRLARQNSYSDLKSCYEKTESRLRSAAKKGDDSQLRKVMLEHRQCEYALLYKMTPAYKKSLKKGVK